MTTAPPQDLTPAPSPGPTPPSPKPARRRRWRLAVALVLLPFIALAALAIGTSWLMKDERGSAWLLRQIPGLTVEAPQGPLLGDFAARRLVLLLPSGEKIAIDGLQWQGIALAWSPSPRLWAALHIARLHADAIDVTAAPATAPKPPSPPPTDLGLSLGLKVDALEVGRISVGALAGRPLLGLRGAVDISADGGARHDVRVDALQWEQLRLAGHARIGTSGELAVDAALQAQPAQQGGSPAGLPDWRGGLTLTGPLQKLQARALLEAAGQQLQAQAQLRPFERWPLAGLQAKAERLDIAALLKDMPQTRLSGEATLQSQGWDRPATLQLNLANEAAGRWDQQRLPVQRVQLAVQLRPDQPQSLQLQSLDALLGSAAAPGGRITGSGGLEDAKRWALKARLDGLRPEALDARAAAMTLGGTIELAGETDLAQPITLAAELKGAVPTGKGKQDGTPLAAALKARLEGLEGREGRRLQLESATLTSGRSRLSLSGQASEDAATGWGAEATLQLQDFDPRLLWAGAPGSAWQTGVTALNAAGSLKLQQDGKTPLPRGAATLNLNDSRLMGLPLSGKLDYLRAAGGEAVLTARLDAAENSLLAVSRMPAAAVATLDLTTQLELKAPRLASLAPLLSLAGPASLQIAGAAEGKAGLHLQQRDGRQRDGTDRRWLVDSDGALQLKDLRLADGKSVQTLKEGRLRWAAGSQPDSPLAFNLQLDRLGAAGQLLTQASIDLQGSWARHQLKLAAQAQPAKGPAAELALALGGALSGSPMLALQDGSSALDWKGRIAQLELKTKTDAGGHPLSAAAAAPAASLPAAAMPAAGAAALAPLLRAAGVDMQLQFAAGSLAVAAAAAAPGQLEVSGAKLRWTELRWQAPLRQGQRPDVRAELQLEPLPLAPLLARWQPDFGWGGTLVVGGHASVRTLPGVQVEAVLERQKGDLSVTDERGPQMLGLTDLRLGLSARDGLWQLTQALAGTQMGSLGGAVAIHTEPGAPWPTPKSRIDGVLQANVARLGTWGAWVPPGWRLGGSLSAGLQFGGTLGGPELIGQARGERISLRNPLQGVDITDGTLALSLNGTTARLDKLAAKAGKGTIEASGRADLGEAATAQLQLKAERFAALSRVDRRLIVSGQAQLDLAPKLLKLDGDFTVDEGLFDLSRGEAPTLGDDVVVVRADQPPVDPRAAAAARPPSERKTRVAVTIKLGNDLKVRGHGLDSRLRGELKLSQIDDGPPQLFGTVSAVGGTYAAYGQKLEVERGDITFAGALENPRLDVLAVRPDVDIRVGVAVTGTALSPRIKLFSEPDMADTDKLSWLLLGRGPDGLGRTDTALLQRAALALLSGEGESKSGKLIKNIGLDELSLAQSEDSTQGTIVRLGKQLSRRWYIGYERGLNATTGSWQLIYRIAQRFTLRAQTGEDNALDLIWQWKWE